MDKSRRHFLALAGLAPVAMLASTRAGAQSAACYNPTTASLADKNRRRSLGYIDVSADAKRHCGLCAFFTRAQGGCGTCQLLTGAPVTPSGVCNSFAPKG